MAAKPKKIPSNPNGYVVVCLVVAFGILIVEVICVLSLMTHCCRYPDGAVKAFLRTLGPLDGDDELYPTFDEIRVTRSRVENITHNAFRGTNAEKFILSEGMYTFETRRLYGLPFTVRCERTNTLPPQRCEFKFADGHWTLVESTMHAADSIAAVDAFERLMTHEDIEPDASDRMCDQE